MLQDYVQQLTKELDMEELMLSPEPGTYIVPFSDNLDIQIKNQNQTLQFKMILGNLPEKNSELFLKRAMEANLFGRGTRHCALGITTDGQLLTLSAEIPEQISYKEFKEKLEDLISVADYWRSEALKWK